MWNEIFEALAPLLFEAIAALLTLLLGWLAVKANKLIGVKIEEKHMRTLHSALMTGVGRVMDGGLTPDEIIQEAMKYARRSAPDAIRALVKEDGVLWSLAEAKLAEVLAARTLAAR